MSQILKFLFFTESHHLIVILYKFHAADITFLKMTVGLLTIRCFDDQMMIRSNFGTERERLRTDAGTNCQELLF